MIAVLALVIGIVAGYAAGGSARGLAEFRLRYEIPLVVAFVVQGFARGRLVGMAPTSWGMGVWVLVSLLLVVLLLLNVDFASARIAAAGVALNLGVVLANTGMPVVSSVESAGRAIRQSAGFYQLAGTGTIMAWAGDALPLRLFGQRFLLSPGDVILMAAVSTLVATAMLTQHGAPGGAVDPGDATADLRGQCH
jgi:Family of unknown function (DUF5317)